MKVKKNKPKPRVAIYDFTDCEGCEVEIISLREKLLALESRVDIVDWRLGQKRKEQGPFFASLIEGSPITLHEVETLKYLRENSTYIIALGSCASLAGIPGIVKKEDRERLYKEIYGPQYQPQGIDAVPLQNYIKVDFSLHGCPINPDEAARILESLLGGKKPTYRGYSVCFDCKLAGNACRLVFGQPCLGPITQGGCNAICVSGGSPCYGCFGLRADPNVPALTKILGELVKEEEADRLFTMFLRQTPEYLNFNKTQRN